MLRQHLEMRAQAHAGLRSEPLGPLDVAVHYAYVLDTTAELSDRLATTLDASERARAARFHFAQDRTHYIAAHSLLRSCLSQIAGSRDWRFTIDRFGKPEIEPPIDEPPLRFSLSHSHGIVACAIARGFPVGIDVETVGYDLPFMEIARNYFSEREYEALLAIERTKRAESFHRIWTLKEALVKAIGLGLSLPLKEFSFDVDPPTLTISPHIDEDVAAWQVVAHAPTIRHHIALAIRRPQTCSLAVSWYEVKLSLLGAPSSEQVHQQPPD